MEVLFRTHGVATWSLCVHPFSSGQVSFAVLVVSLDFMELAHSTQMEFLVPAPRGWTFGFEVEFLKPQFSFHGSGSLMRLQSRCQLGLYSPEGLTGAEGPTSKVTCSHGWQETLVSHLWPVHRVA